jgi:uncharacterized repeat protein (TIGR02543 family)
MGGDVGRMPDMRGKFYVFAVLWLACWHAAQAQIQLISNGDFDAGTSAPWQVGGPDAVEVQFEPGYASMGSANGAEQLLFQTITCPTNLIGATLSFQYYVSSSNPYGDDELIAGISDINNDAFLDNFGTNYSADTTTNFAYATTNFITYRGSNLLSSYAGQTINVVFAVDTDPTYGYLTSFYINDVSLLAYTTADIPANDNFTNAEVFTSDDLTNEVTTICASREQNEPDIAGNRGGHSVWWSWTAPDFGTVTIKTAGSDFNTLLGVYTGTALSNLVVVTNSDGYKLSSGVAAVKFKVSQGTTYQITLDGYDGQTGEAVFAFAFVSDATPPTVAIKSPAAGADLTSSTVLVEGTASDAFGLAAVEYQLENAHGSNAWQLAAGTTNWSATVTNLIPGTNTVRVKAIDVSSNVSTIVSRVFNYFLSVPLTLTKVGEGAVSGATNGQLLHVGYPYKLTATAASGFKFVGWTGDYTTNTATLSFIVTTNVSLTANFVETAKPILSITAPKANERESNSTFTVTGKASDLVSVASVQYELNTNGWMELATNVNTANGFTNWNVNVNLNPGTNTIKAFAINQAGIHSATNSVSFIYVLSAPFTVRIIGQGKISPDYTSATLEISNNYTLTATAATGYVFSNWVASTGAESSSPVLKFSMASNLSYTLNFIPNPFTHAVGAYQGLFYNRNEVAQAGSGFFSAQVTGSGSFTAKFQQGNASYPVSGQFSLTGAWSTNALKTWGDTAISLQLDLTNGAVLDGDLTNANAAWSAELDANRAVYASANPAPQAGKKYTLILPGTNLATQPGGNGFGSVTVATGGSVTFSGTLGDGTAVTPSGTESAQGQWPFYISLYSGRGMMMGWLTFTNEPDRDIDGQLYWFKPSMPATTLYPAGFTNELEVAGSEYSYVKNVPVLGLTNGYVLLEGGGLAQSISNQFFLESSSIVSGSNKLVLTMTTSTGLFKGAAPTTNAAGKAASISFSGAVLQKQTNGFGLFLNGAQSGGVSIAPQ